VKLQVRAAALRDFDGIYDYALAAHGVAQAEAYMRGLWAAIESLCAFSEIRVGERLAARIALTGGEPSPSVLSDRRRCHGRRARAAQDDGCGTVALAG
jgi:plasmid stabilization system protein ParE